jgi:hypothetical protein
MKTKTARSNRVEEEKNESKKKWQKPKLEDVSGKVMAQPYIRFT